MYFTLSLKIYRRKQSMTKYFNALAETSYSLDFWKIAKKIPTAKPGKNSDKLQPFKLSNNFITLNTGKLLKKLVIDELSNHNSAKKKICIPKQFVSAT